MAYRTKVEVWTNGKVYAPGSILPTDMSKIDLDFLKKRKFIELVEIDERVAAGEPAVVTCSALKKIYRDKLRRQGVVFVYMQGTFDEVMERLSHRQGHFMKPSMLQSQSDILEEPGDDEIHVNVHIGQADPEHEAMAVAGALGL